MSSDAGCRHLLSPLILPSQNLPFWAALVPSFFYLNIVINAIGQVYTIVPEWKIAHLFSTIKWRCCKNSLILAIDSLWMLILNCAKQWVGQRSKLASNNFISKLQRRCTDLSFITTHIKALIKGSISRLLWLEDLFQEMPPSNICRWRDLLYVAALQLLASLVFHLLGPQSQHHQYHSCHKIASLSQISHHGA